MIKEGTKTTQIVPTQGATRRDLSGQFYELVVTILNRSSPRVCDNIRGIPDTSFIRSTSSQQQKQLHNQTSPVPPIFGQILQFAFY